MLPGAPGCAHATPPLRVTSWLPGVRTNRAERPEWRSHALRPCTQQALAHGDGRPRGGHNGLDRDRHRRPSQAGIDELRELRMLPLVLASPGPRAALARPGPDRGFPEVVEPRTAATRRGVNR